jgi:hypothetical protein
MSIALIEVILWSVVALEIAGVAFVTWVLWKGR